MEHLGWQVFQGDRLELRGVGAVGRCMPGEAGKDELTCGERSAGSRLALLGAVAHTVIPEPQEADRRTTR